MIHSLWLLYQTFQEAHLPFWDISDPWRRGAFSSIRVWVLGLCLRIVSELMSLHRLDLSFAFGMRGFVPFFLLLFTTSHSFNSWSIKDFVWDASQRDQPSSAAKVVCKNRCMMSHYGSKLASRFNQTTACVDTTK